MPFLRILARAASRPTPCLTAALLLSVSFAAQADWNVAVGAASSNGAWSGANPDVWTPSATGATVAASEINSRLTAGTLVVINTSGGGAESGDISVNSAVTWAANELTLTAARNIAINASLNGSGTAKLYLRYGFGTGAGGYTLSNGAKVNLPAGGNFSTQLNLTGLVAWTVITDLGVANDATVAPGIMTLQGMNTGLAGNYVLGADIGAIPTEAWGGAGFVPVGTLATGFTGSFDGLGHQINDLWINRPTTSYVGLFGYASGATLRNVGLTTSTISGKDWVGTLLGSGMANTVIDNSYADSGTVNAASAYSGGLAGSINGSISNSHARIGVTGGIGGTSGGLVGRSDAAISNSYAADGLVSSTEAVGGLVGTAPTGSIATATPPATSAARATSWAAWWAFPSSPFPTAMPAARSAVPAATWAAWRVTTRGRSAASGTAMSRPPASAPTSAPSPPWARPPPR